MCFIAIFRDDVLLLWREKGRSALYLKFFADSPDSILPLTNALGNVRELLDKDYVSFFAATL